MPKAGRRSVWVHLSLQQNFRFSRRSRAAVTEADRSASAWRSSGCHGVVASHVSNELPCITARAAREVVVELAGQLHP